MESVPSTLVIILEKNERLRVYRKPSVRLC